MDNEKKLELLKASMKDHRVPMPRPCIFRNKKHPDSKARRVAGKKLIEQELGEYLF